MPGARCARGLACSKKTREFVTTVTPESPGIPRAMVLTVSFVVSPECRACCLRRPRNAQHCRELDISVGISGPHDFAVRIGAARLAAPQRPPHPAPNVRDDRETPLVSRKSGRTCERAVVAKPPVAGTEPVTPQRRQSLY